MILAGDIGGTKTNLGLFESQGSPLVPFFERSYHTKEFPTLNGLLADFLSGQSVRLTGASFGIAAPIVDGHADAPNFPWHVAVSDLRQYLKISHVGLINDLQAMALGVGTLPPESLALLNEGHRQPQGDQAVIAAGTGLGEAALVRDAQQRRVIPSEGGHVDFAPRNECELELLRVLWKRFGRVSYERVLSGPGLQNIYAFLRDYRRAPEPPAVTENMRLSDPAAVITDFGLSGNDPICREALEMFASIYGAEAGNLALKFFATGGIFVGGGIAPKILGVLKAGGFMEAFTDKGRLAPLMRSIPVQVILDPRAPLFGAAQYGFTLLGDGLSHGL